MPNNASTPRRRLTTWDKVTVYAFDCLAFDHSARSGDNYHSYNPSTVSVIEHKVNELLASHGMAGTSSRVDTTSAVDFCLRRLYALGIVLMCPYSSNARQYQLKAESGAVCTLVRELRLELIDGRSFNSDMQPGIYSLIFNRYQRRMREVRGLCIEFNRYQQQVREREPHATTQQTQNSMETVYSQRREQAIHKLGL